MNDEIHTARFVTKTHTTNVATFRTPTFGPVGLVTEDGVRFFQELINQEVCAIDHLCRSGSSSSRLMPAWTAPCSMHLPDRYPRPCRSKRSVPAIFRRATLACHSAAAGPSTSRLCSFPAVSMASRRPFTITKAAGCSLRKWASSSAKVSNGQKARIKLQVGLSDGKQGPGIWPTSWIMLWLSLGN